jgi:hypothetical protein
MRCLFALIILLLPAFHLPAQSVRKSAEAVRTNASIKIDGILDEEAWEMALPANGFIQRLRTAFLYVCCIIWMLPLLKRKRSPVQADPITINRRHCYFDIVIYLVILLILKIKSIQKG